MIITIEENIVENVNLVYCNTDFSCTGCNALIDKYKLCIEVKAQVADTYLCENCIGSIIEISKDYDLKV